MLTKFGFARAGRGMALGLCAIGVGITAPASATVTYEFSGSVVSDPNVIFNFSLTTPDFINENNVFSPADLSSCSVVGFQSFDCSTVTINSTASFTNVVQLYLFGEGTFGALFQFGPEVFQSVGTFNTPFFGQQTINGTLVVTDNGGGGGGGGGMPAVPEPATWGMLIAGFGLVGGALRWRRQAALSA